MGKGNCVEMGRHGRRTAGGSVTFNAHAIKREKKENCNVGNRHAYGKGHSSRLPRINSCTRVSMGLTYEGTNQSYIVRG